MPFWTKTHFCRPPFTDYVDSEGGVEGGSGPVELPSDADLPDAEIQYDDDNDDIQAVESEFDNYLIDQSEAQCKQVRGRIIIRCMIMEWYAG